MPSTSDRIRALQAEAKAEARIACSDFAERLLQLAEEAKDIYNMGDAVPVGIRQLASTIAPAATGQALNVRKLLQ